MKVEKIQRAELLLMWAYMLPYILVNVGYLSNAVYMGYGNLGMRYFQYSLYLLLFLPPIVGYSIRFFPKEMQKVLCKGERYLDVTDKFLQRIIYWNFFLLPGYLLYIIIANIYPIVEMPVMSVVDAFFIALMTIGLGYFMKLVYAHRAYRYQYIWCQRWRK